MQRKLTMRARSKFPRLGARQATMLEFLGDFGGEWYDGCGRHWNTISVDTAVYRSLVKLGLVEEQRTQGPRNDLTERPSFVITKKGRDHYYAMTGRRVGKKRRTGLKGTGHKSTGSAMPQSANSFIFSSERGPATISYYDARKDGIQGWTVSSSVDRHGNLVLGDTEVWWCVVHGSVAAKTLAKQKAREINKRRDPGGPEAQAVPIRIA